MRPTDDSEGDASHAETPSGDFADGRLVRRLEPYFRSKEACIPGARERLLQEYPLAADKLHACLDAPEFIKQVLAAEPPAAKESGVESPEQAKKPLGCTLGDFTITAEVGRGGMGIVYSADQISLRRRVALKVLPAVSELSSRRLQRFQNESAAAARLEHSNIVRVYAVGCERGVHYYAMQYIEGQSVAQVIEALRTSVMETGDEEPGTLLVSGFRGVLPQFGDSANSGRTFRAGGTTATLDAPPVPAPDDAVADSAAAAISPIRIRGREFYCSAACIGLQAAEALDYAHEAGVIHRDVKPSNLLLDTRGHVWVTDFGLALDQTTDDPTTTGDIVGTVQYMSPEQAGSQHERLDRRTDIYSLGATLYELLTLRAPFIADSRQGLLEQVREGKPLPPRRLNSCIPRDLETIVLKAMANDPAARYASAKALADDLRRFMEDKPITARRPSFGERVARGIRHHRLAAFSAPVVVAAILGLWLSNVAQRMPTRGISREISAARPLLDNGGGTTVRNWVRLNSLPAYVHNPGVPVHRDTETGKLWTETLGAIPAANFGQAARERVEALGFRLPRYDEFLQMYVEHRGGSVLGIHTGPLDYYETSSPDVLGKAVRGAFLRQERGRATEAGQVWYVGVKNPPMDTAVYCPESDDICFFRGRWYQQFNPQQDRVVKTGRIGVGRWKGVWTDGMDAALYHPMKKAVFFFRGGEYQQFDLQRNQVVESARIDDDTWKGVWIDGIDAAVYHPGRNALYFFRKDRFRRFDLDENQVIKEGAISASGWKGVWTMGIEAAVYRPDKKAIYFFRGDQYQNYNLDERVNQVVETGKIGEDGWIGVD